MHVSVLTGSPPVSPADPIDDKRRYGTIPGGEILLMHATRKLFACSGALSDISLGIKRLGVDASCANRAGLEDEALKLKNITDTPGGHPNRHSGFGMIPKAIGAGKEHDVLDNCK